VIVRPSRGLENAVVFLQFFAAGSDIDVAFGIVGEVAARKASVPPESQWRVLPNDWHMPFIVAQCSKPDALTVIGVDRRSANFGKTVDRLDMP
jgi:hypothetical protein